MFLILILIICAMLAVAVPESLEILVGLPNPSKSASFFFLLLERREKKRGADKQWNGCRKRRCMFLEEVIGRMTKVEWLSS